MRLNNYLNCELDWCNNDAISMKEIIESNGDGSLDFDVMPIIKSCTKEQLRAAIAQLFMGNDDIALLCFLGHGAERELQKRC